MSKVIEKKIKRTFSGHETFSCRSYWPKKGYEFLNKGYKFNEIDALVKLGVGKNMVSSIKHWVKSFGIVNNDGSLSSFWSVILDNKGYDPYLENKGTLWLLHYYIVKTNYANLYNEVFNEFRKEKIEFVKSQLLKFIISKLEIEGFKNFTINTIDKDVNVLLRNYCFSNSIKHNLEDDLSSLLIELELIEKVDVTSSNEQYYAFNVTERLDLPWQIFLYIVLDLFSEETTVDLHSLETKVNSPGLLFCMNKVGIINKMQEISVNISDVVYKNDAGIITVSGLDKLDKNKILAEYYAA
ncbi:MAG: DUF4007 family protein [Flavobacteriales bacterium]|jgi:hypothetical protein|nr:DUF4007 family protein [Flavobacteriales bacterium]